MATTIECFESDPSCQGFAEVAENVGPLLDIGSGLSMGFTLTLIVRLILILRSSEEKRRRLDFDTSLTTQFMMIGLAFISTLVFAATQMMNFEAVTEMQGTPSLQDVDPGTWASVQLAVMVSVLGLFFLSVVTFLHCGAMFRQAFGLAAPAISLVMVTTLAVFVPAEDRGVAAVFILVLGAVTVANLFYGVRRASAFAAEASEQQQPV